MPEGPDSTDRPAQAAPVPGPPGLGETTGAAAPPARFAGGSLRLMRVAGIDVFVHWTWLIAAYYQIYFRATEHDPAPWQAKAYGSPAWAVAEYLTLFGIVLLHEFGHSLACRSVGGIANRIILWPLGGVALVTPPPRPGPYLWTMAAGPLVNVALVPVTWGVFLLGDALGWQEVWPDLHSFLFIVAALNVWLLAFNLLPIFPLDGGKILHALLWFVLGRARSLMVVSALGPLAAASLLAAAIALESPPLSVLAGFAVLLCLVGLAGARQQARILQAPRHEDYHCPTCRTEPPVGPFWNCRGCFKRYDPFAGGGICPGCRAPNSPIICPHCGQLAAFAAWNAATPFPAAAARPADPVPYRPTPRERVIWAVVLGVLGLALGACTCGTDRLWGVPPLGVAGAVIGATSAGPLTRFWRSYRACNKLRGTWRLAEVDGQSAPGTDGEPRRLVVAGNRFTEKTGDQVTARGTFTLDATATPPTIRVTQSFGPEQGQTWLGIWEHADGVFRVCLAPPDQERPAAFALRPGCRLLVYRREKAGARQDAKDAR